MLHYGHPQSTSVGGAVGRHQRISGLVVPLPPAAEMNAPAIQEALTAAQEVASILEPTGNSCADSAASSNSLDGQSSGKPMILHLTICQRMFAVTSGLSCKFSV